MIWFSDLQSWEPLHVDYHGSTATFGLGGRGQPADVTARNNGEMHAAISMTHLNSSKHMKSPANAVREKVSETERLPYFTGFLCILGGYGLTSNTVNYSERLLIWTVAPPTPIKKENSMNTVHSCRQTCSSASFNRTPLYYKYAIPLAA